MLSSRKFKIAMLATVAAVAAVALGGVGPAAASADEPTIGVIVPTLDSEFWNRYVAFTKMGAEALGEKLIILNADNKPDQIIQFVQDLVARKVNGIIECGYWSSAPPTIMFAQRANIPVIIVDTYPDSSRSPENTPTTSRSSDRATKTPAITWARRCFARSHQARTARR